jgi:translation initiation factor IF-1
MRRFRIRSVVGDAVRVEMTPYDLTKGRVIYRERGAGAPVGAQRKRR